MMVGGGSTGGQPDAPPSRLGGRVEPQRGEGC